MTRKILLRLGVLLASVALVVPAAWAEEPPQANSQIETLKLEELVSEALRANPAIQRDLLRVEAQRARIPQARALPDPTLSIGYMGDFAPFNLQANDPSSNRQIAATQEFPFPGKRRLRGEIATRAADAMNWDYETTRRRIAAEVKLAYYKLAYLERAIETTQKNKELLAKLAKVAEARYTVGSGIQQDVLKAQLEVSRLLERLTVLEQQAASVRARLNALLNRPPDSPLGHTAELTKPELRFTLEELNQMAVANDPGLKKEETLIEQSQLAVNLAQKEYYPDFATSFAYQNRISGQPEMFGWTFTVKLPVFYKDKQRQAVLEASRMLSAARQSRESVRTLLFFEIKQRYLEARAAEELLKLYSKAIVPQSVLALDSALASYETGKVDFLTVLSNFTTVRDYELNYYEAMASYAQALARLEEMVGTELTK